VHFSIAGQAALADLTFPLAFAPPRATQPRPAGSAPTPRRSSAKLKVKRASLPSGRLNVLLGITGRATGKLQVKLEAGGRTSFSVDVGSSGSKEKQVRIDRPLPVAGTVDPRVDGSVRLRVTYTRSKAPSPPSTARRASPRAAGRPTRRCRRRRSPTPRPT